MISYIKGKLISKNPNFAIIENQGLGYFINLSFNSFEQLPEINSEIKLLTILIPREDSINLFGFVSEEEKLMFENLISVSGIGPKLAINILSGVKSSDLKAFISTGNINRLINIPGIGKKTAERIIVELRDKISKITISPVTDTEDSDERNRNEAFQALITLGYQRIAAEKAIRTAFSELPNDKRSIEELIKKALNILNS